jgi:cellulose synthase/poly-beta-1,6-N-acetylglucosamine synthase-like glycosyltransferase
MTASDRQGSWEWTPGASGVKRELTAMVSVYNAERFIDGLLADLLAQTMIEQIEILVCDGASPTNEGEAVRALMRERPDLAIGYLRTAERESCAATTNRCVQVARGTYLTMANADDRHRPDALEVLVGKLDERPDVDLVYADCAVTEAENEDPVTTTAVCGYLSWPDFDPQSLFASCYVGPQPLYRRSLHERFGLYDESFLANDYEFYLRVVRQGVRFLHVPEVLGLYLRSPHGIEHGNQARILADSERARALHWPAEWGAR